MASFTCLSEGHWGCFLICLGNRKEKKGTELTDDGPTREDKGREAMSFHEKLQNCSCSTTLSW